ncbi:MAG: hypothetical protein ACTHMH_03090 [Curtobacterium sp.]
MMSRRSRRPQKVLLSTLAALAMVALVAVGHSDARADTRPPSASTPPTVSADALATPQINGVVWSQIIVGDTV